MQTTVLKCKQQKENHCQFLPLLVLSHIYSQTVSFTKQYNEEPLSRVYFKFMKHIKSNKNVYFTKEKLCGKLNIK